MPDSSLPSVCVVTQPARRRTGKTHAHQLLDILAASTSVVLLTANLSDDASVRDDHEVIEFTTTGTGDVLPVTVYRFLRNQFLMARAIRKRRETAVLFFGATAYLFPMLVAKATGMKVIVEPRGDVPLSLRLKWEQQLPAPVANLLAKAVALLEHCGYILSDVIVVYTPSMAEELGLSRYEHKLHTDGARYVDTERFSPEIPFTDRDIVVGYLGRLDVEKRVPMLVDVVKRLSDSVSVLFVGDGAYRTTIERELGTDIESGRVTVTGWIDHEDVPAYLNRMRLLVLTSEPTEGLPTAILEAFACGTPVYAPPVSGVTDVVREGETGLLMREEDPNVIAERIEEALEENRLEAMSESCRNYATSEFSFEAATRRYRAVLETVTA